MTTADAQLKDIGKQRGMEIWRIKVLVPSFLNSFVVCESRMIHLEKIKYFYIIYFSK